MKLVLVMVAAAAIAASAAGCDEKLNDMTGPTPGLSPTFSSIQQEIFNTTDASGRAACIRCHTDSGRTPAGNLVLLEGRSYANLVNRQSTGKPGAVLVIPGNADDSYLVHKIEGQSDIVGERMPATGGPFLTSDQIRVIREWITMGAPND